MSEGRGVKAIAATGMLGSGFLEESLSRATQGSADFIGCDAGSTDAGPYYLGSGETKSSDAAVKRDLRLILREAMKHDIPAIVGSAGYSGGRPHLLSVVNLVRELASENDWHFKLASIDCEVDKGTLLNAYRNGALTPMDPSPVLNEGVIENAQRFVAMMGVEPFQRALNAGAQIIIAGRASDVTIYAALPILRGIPRGVAYHAGKILECGAASVERRAYPDCMVAELDQNGFTVGPPNPAMRCTPRSVLAHTLYENSNPLYMLESGGTLDTSKSQYQSADERSVRVTGSSFVPSDKYTVRVEGASVAGYRSVAFAGIADPVVIRQLDSYLLTLRKLVERKVQESLGLDNRQYTLNLQVYGSGGDEQTQAQRVQWHGVYHRAVLIDVVAETQKISSAINTVAWHTGLHVAISEYEGLISNFAFPFSPPNIAAGPVYRFCVNHLWTLSDPCAPFHMVLEDL